MTRPQRARFPVLLAAVALFLGATFVLLTDPVSYWVTWAALRDCAGTTPASDDEGEQAVQRLVERYGAWFRRGWLGRELLLERADPRGPVRANWPVILVGAAYFSANKERFDLPAEALENFWRDEIAAWARAWLPRSRSRELLVSFFFDEFVGRTPTLDGVEASFKALRRALSKATRVWP